MRTICASVWVSGNEGGEVKRMRNKSGLIDKKSFRDFVHCTCMAFSMQTVVAVLMMFITSSDTATEQMKISSIYENPGFLSKETILQFFIVALLTSMIRHIFFSDKVIRIPSIALRITLMFTTEIAMVAVAVWKFRWFHSVSPAHWVGFAIGAAPCLVAGVILAFKTEMKENETMNEALHRAQENAREVPDSRAEEK